VCVCVCYRNILCSFNDDIYIYIVVLKSTLSKLRCFYKYFRKIVGSYIGTFIRHKSIGQLTRTKKRSDSIQQ